MFLTRNMFVVLNTSYQYFLKHFLSVSSCDNSLMKSAHKNVVTVPRVLVIRPSPYTSAFPREGSLYFHLLWPSAGGLVSGGYACLSAISFGAMFAHSLLDRLGKFVQSYPFLLCAP